MSEAHEGCLKVIRDALNYGADPRREQLDVRSDLRRARDYIEGYMSDPTLKRDPFASPAESGMPAKVPSEKNLRWMANFERDDSQAWRQFAAFSRAILAGDLVVHENRGNCEPWPELLAQRDAAIQRAEKAERNVAKLREAIQDVRNNLYSSVERDRNLEARCDRALAETDPARKEGSGT